MLNTRAVQVDVADVTIVMIEIIAIGVAVGAIGWITMDLRDMAHLPGQITV